MNTMGLKGKGKFILGYLKGLAGLNKTYCGMLKGKPKGKVKERSRQIEDNKCGRREDKGGQVHVKNLLIVLFSGQALGLITTVCLLIKFYS